MLGLVYICVIVIVFILWTLIGRLIVRAIRKRGGRWWWPMLVVLSLPVITYFILWPQQIPAYRRFDDLCQTNAGTEIFETVDNVEGVYIEGMFPPQVLMELGYRYFDKTTLTGGYIRARDYVSNEGVWRAETKIITSPSPYRVMNKQIAHEFHIVEMVTEFSDADRGVVLARKRELAFSMADLSEWERYTQFWISSGRACANNSDGVDEPLLTRVFKPIGNDPFELYPQGRLEPSIH